MAERSKIEWTDASWNPIQAHRTFEPAGRYGKLGWHCEHVSEACCNCYAKGFNKRLGTELDYKPGHRLSPEPDTEIFLDEKMLLAPLRWKRPRKIFVCSMTDLFGDWVEDEWLDRIFAVMALCPQHTFQLLTKRQARMRKYAGDQSFARADGRGAAVIEFGYERPLECLS